MCENAFYINIKEIEYYEPFKISLNIKNGSCFSFYDINYKYVYNSYENKLIICSFEKMDDITMVKVKTSLSILSYLGGVPIAELNEIQGLKEKITIVNSNNKKIQKLNAFNDKLSDIKDDKKKLFLKIVNFFYSGLKYEFRGLYEESYMNYYKTIEILTKEYFKSFYIKKSNFDNTKLFVFLEKYINESAGITYDQSKMNNIVGNVKSCIKDNIEKDIYDKISFFLNHENIKFDAKKLQKYVNLRNGLAHGDVIDEDYVKNNVNPIKSLCQNIISSYFFRKKYDDIKFDAKVELHKGSRWI